MADNQTKIVISAVDATQAAFQSVGRGLKGVEDGASRLNTIADRIPLLGTALAAALGGASITGFIKSTIDAADNLNDLSARVGVGIKELAGYKLAAEQSGASLESVAKGVKGLSTYMAEHGDAMKAAGITARDTDGAMTQLADVFAALPDGMEKSALATKLFGKAGMDLIPLLNLGSKGLQEAKDKAEEYGRKMAELAPLADKFNDQIEELSLHSKAAGIGMANVLMPSLVHISEQMAVAANNGGILKAVLVGLGASLGEIGGKDMSVRGIAERRVDSAFSDLAAAKKDLEDRQSALEATRNQLGPVGVAFKESQVERARKDVEDSQRELRAANAARNALIPKTTEGTAGLSTEAATKAAQEILGQKTAADAAASAYDNLIKSIREKLAVEQAAGQQSEALTEGEKMRAKFTADLAAGTLRLSAAKQDQVKADLASLIAQEKANASNREWIKFQDAARNASRQRVQSLEESARAVEDEVSNYGLAKSAIEANTLARLEEARAIVLAHGATADQLKDLDAEIEARRRLSTALGEKETKDANKKAVDDAAAEWKRFSDDIERSLTDALMRGFEGGKDAGQNFIDSLRNMLKTAALKIVVQALVNPIMGTLQGALGGGSTGTGATGGMGSLGSGLSFANSIANSIANSNAGFYNAYGSFAGSSIGQSLGLTDAASFVGPQMAGQTAQVGLTSLGQNLQTALPYLPALYNLSQGNYGAAIGAGLGAYFGGPIGSAIGSAIGGMFDGGGEDPHNNPSVSGYTLSLSQAGVGGSGFAARGAGADQAASILAGSTSGSGMWGDATVLPDAQVAALGLQVSAMFADAYRLAVQAGVDPSVVNSASTNSHTDGTAHPGIDRVFNTLDDALAALGNSIAEKILPTVAEFRIGNEALSQTLLRVMGNVKAMDTITQHLGMTLNTSGDLASRAKAASSLVAAGGGAEAFGANLGAFYQNFYSDTERQAAALEDLRTQFDTLGVAMPATRDQFRALVTGLDITTDSGQTLFGQLLALSPAFASVTDAANLAAAASSKLADAQQQLTLSDLSPLNAAQKYKVEGDMLQKAYATALGGDQAAIDTFIKTASGFLGSSRENNASGDAYTSDFSRVQSMYETLKTMTSSPALGIPGVTSVASASAPLAAPQTVPYDNYQTYAPATSPAPTATNSWQSGTAPITSTDLSALRGDIQRLIAAVQEGTTGVIDATQAVATTQTALAFRSELQGVVLR